MSLEGELIDSRLELHNLQRPHVDVMYLEERINQIEERSAAEIAQLRELIASHQHEEQRTEEETPAEEVEEEAEEAVEEVKEEAPKPDVPPKVTHWLGRRVGGER